MFSHRAELFIVLFMRLLSLSFSMNRLPFLASCFCFLRTRNKKLSLLGSELDQELTLSQSCDCLLVKPSPQPSVSSCENESSCWMALAYIYYFQIRDKLQLFLTGYVIITQWSHCSLVFNISLQAVSISATANIQMFSTQTDRFFHGMNRKNTKLVQATKFQLNLSPPARSHKKSQSRGKTTRLFEMASHQSTRASINQTLKLNFTNTSSTISANSFGPPKVLRRNDKNARQTDRDEQRYHGVVAAELEGDILVMPSLKQRSYLKTKIEDHALKRYRNFHQRAIRQEQNQIVSQDNIRQLLQLLQQPQESKVASRQEITTETTKKQQIQPERGGEQKRKQQDIKRMKMVCPESSSFLTMVASQDAKDKLGKQSQGFSKAKQQPEQPLVKTNTSSLVPQPVPPVSKPAATQIKNEQKAHPPAVTQHNLTTKSTKASDRAAKSDMKIYEKSDKEHSKKVNREPSVKIQQQPQTGQKNSSKQGNSFWNQVQDNAYNDPMPQPKESKIPQDSGKKVKTQTKAPPPPARPKISTYQQDELEEVDLRGQKNSPRNSQQQPPSRNKTQISQKPNIKQGGNNHSQEGGQPEEEDSHFIDDVDYLLMLVDTIGEYHIRSKKFYEKQKVMATKTYRVTSYYMWQQLYYLRQMTIDKFSTAESDWFEVPKRSLQLWMEDQFLIQKVQQLKKQNQKCKEIIKKVYNEAKDQMDARQRVFSIDKKVNYFSKCIKMLQEEFKEVQKSYKTAFKSGVVANQHKLLERLCYLIEIYCLLKHLNNQKVLKQFVEVEQIEDYNSHYQNYKHLISI